MADTCRTCGAPILWATTQAGKFMPLDEKEYLVAETSEDDDGKLLISRMVRGHVSHFATCAQAAQHRRPEASHGQG